MFFTLSMFVLNIISQSSSSLLVVSGHFRVPFNIAISLFLVLVSSHLRTGGIFYLTDVGK